MKELDLGPGLSALGLVLFLFVFAHYPHVGALPGVRRVDPVGHLLTLPVPLADIAILLGADHANADRAHTLAHINFNP